MFGIDKSWYMMLIKTIVLHCTASDSSYSNVIALEQMHESLKQPGHAATTFSQSWTMLALLP